MPQQQQETYGQQGPYRSNSYVPPPTQPQGVYQPPVGSVCNGVGGASSYVPPPVAAMGGGGSYVPPPACGGPCAQGGYVPPMMPGAIGGGGSYVPPPTQMP